MQRVLVEVNGAFILVCSILVMMEKNQIYLEFSILMRIYIKKLHLELYNPVTGLFFTADDAVYVYTGFQIPYKSGSITFTPSFTPGIYDKGDGKDLGHTIEFKTELQISVDISKNSQLGVSYNHISNASLGEKNPGANSYMFNFIKKF